MPARTAADARPSDAASLRAVVMGGAPVLVDAVVALLSRHGVDATTAPPRARRGEQAVRVVLVRASTLSHDSATLRRELDRRGASVMALIVDDVTACAPVVVRTGCPTVVPASATTPELLDAVRAAAAGEPYVHATVLASALGDLRAATSRRRASPLSPREHDVLVLMASGHGTPEMAARLQIAESTVKTHVLSVFEKLGTHDRAHAVATAMRAGLID